MDALLAQYRAHHASPDGRCVRCTYRYPCLAAGALAHKLLDAGQAVPAVAGAPAVSPDMDRRQAVATVREHRYLLDGSCSGCTPGTAWPCLHERAGSAALRRLGISWADISVAWPPARRTVQ